MANANMTAPQWLEEHFRQAPGNQLPWAEVMHLALYEPGHGYYRQGVRRIGRSGDFYTSVSVGGLYGSLIGVLARKVWLALGSPNDFLLVEQGAHDGQLAFDVLTSLAEHDPELANYTKLFLVEPDEGLRKAQQEKLSAWPTNVEWVSDWNTVPKGHGLIYCNELLDAFAVHRLQWRNGEWHELWVAMNADGSLTQIPGKFSSEQVAQEAAALLGDFAEGQIVELNLAMLSWLQEVSATNFEGVLLVADYGLPEPELLMPERMEGTLRRYHRHQCDGDLLKDPGESDLTSHVNFTRLTKHAKHLGWQLLDFIEQGRFLTRLASDWMKRPDFAPSSSWIRQFQSLTHPDHLGQSFHALALAKGKLADEFCATFDSASAERRLGLV